MSRSGYDEDYESDNNWGWIQWAGRVASSIRGKRGQAMLRALRDALDAMEVKALVKDSLVTRDGDCCAIGALLKQREPPYMVAIFECQDGGEEDELEEFNEIIAEDLDVAAPLVQEIVYQNDERCSLSTPEERWTKMRAWVEKYIREEVPA